MFWPVSEISAMSSALLDFAKFMKRKNSILQNMRFSEFMKFEKIQINNRIPLISWLDKIYLVIKGIHFENGEVGPG